jgi:hypothetical protein
MKIDIKLLKKNGWTVECESHSTIRHENGSFASHEAAVSILVSLSLDKQQPPTKSGWYWVLLEGYKTPIPCWYMGPDSFSSYEVGQECFLPGGIGDSSSNGFYMDEVEKVGPEIIVPKF